VLTAQPLRAIHHRVAVGAGGTIYRYASGGWKQAKQLENALGAVERYAVWGADLAGGDELYLLAGEAGVAAMPAGVYACTVGATGWPSCTGQDGFEGVPLLGAVSGTLTAAGGAGPAWAVSTGQWEDIYYLAPGASTWTHEAPHGCYDTPGNPCHNPTSGSFAGLDAAGPADAWVVGSGGLLLRYDGAAAGGMNLSRFDLPEMNATIARLQALPEGPEREALFDHAKRLTVAWMPYKLRTHLAATALAQPWLVGFRRPLFWNNWFEVVDIEPHSRHGGPDA